MYKGFDKQSGMNTAIKMIRLEDEDEGISPSAIREVSVLKELEHRNVVS